MLPFHTILHPTDFSPRSTPAFELACELARNSGGRLILLHAHPIPAIVYAGGFIPEPAGVIWETMQRKLVDMTAMASYVPIETDLFEGEPAPVILDVARRENCDVIVMGTHGRTGLGRMLMGSVAEAVVRRACCPVLTVKTPDPEKGDSPARREVAHA